MYFLISASCEPLKHQSKVFWGDRRICHSDFQLSIIEILNINEIALMSTYFKKVFMFNNIYQPNKPSHSFHFFYRICGSQVFSLPETARRRPIVPHALSFLPP